MQYPSHLLRLAYALCPKFEFPDPGAKLFQFRIILVREIPLVGITLMDLRSIYLTAPLSASRSSLPFHTFAPLAPHLLDQEMSGTEQSHSNQPAVRGAFLFMADV